jgi:tetratricopeptide (TPR) repeat protein
LKNDAFALTDISKYLQYDKENPESLLLSASILEQLGDYRGTAEVLMAYQKTNPDNLDLMLRCGTALTRSGQFTIADSWLNHCLQRFPESFELYQLRGSNHHAAGNYTKAIEDYNLCLLNKPNSAVLFALRAASNNELGASKEALFDYQRALALDSSNGNYYLELGLIRLEAQEFAGAEQDFNQALKYKCDDLRYAMMARGLVRYNLRKGNEACADWERASLLGSAEASAYLLRYCAKVANPHE